MKSTSFPRHMTRMALIGLGIGLIMFLFTQSGLFEIPIVIGTTSYEGMTSSLMLLTGFPILLLLVGLILYGVRKR